MKRKTLAVLLSWNAACLFVRLCSFALPVSRQDGWRKEWKGELWQVRASSRNGLDLLRFAMGALPDAVCLGLSASEEPSLQPLPASRCIFVLTSIVVLTTAIAWSLPRVRAEFRQRNWKGAQNLSVRVLPTGENEAAPTVTPEHFLLWKERAHELHDLVCYQIADRTVRIQGRTMRLRVAHVAGDLSTMVGDRDLIRRTGQTTQERLVLSRRAWQRSFHSEPSVEGQHGAVDGHAARISDVVDLEDSGLPGEYDAWLFDSKPLEPGVPGFVIGRFAAGTVTNPYFGFDHFSVRETQETEVSGLAFAVADRKVSPWATFGFGLH